MSYLVGFSADIVGDTAAGRVLLGDSGEYRMIERRIADLGLFHQQVARDR